MHLSGILTGQQTRTNAREIRNNAGGYVYGVDPWHRLDRFLVLGTMGGTYYVNERQHTTDNAQAVWMLLQEDGPRVVRRVQEISEAGRAPKQDYGLFVLALAASLPIPAATDETYANAIATRRAAYAALPHVCRTASTLFRFLAYLWPQFTPAKNGESTEAPTASQRGRRGWSRGLRHAIADWYNRRDVDDLAYQIVKYGQRYGFDHAAAIRLGHPNPLIGATREAASNPRRERPVLLEERDTLYKYALGKEPTKEHPELISARVPTLILAKHALPAVEEHERAGYVRRTGLPREALPDEWLASPDVWEALLYGEEGRGMPLTALIRNLPKMTRVGLLTPGSDAVRYVVGEVTNETRLRQSRVHPMQLLVAARTYASGRSATRGSMRDIGTNWTPVAEITRALEYGFRAAFPNVTPAGVHVMVGLDVSGSMGEQLPEFAGLSVREAACAMALVQVATEPSCEVMAFSSHIVDFPISREDSLTDVINRANKMPFSGTDCALPMIYAVKAAKDIDGFVVYTDNETWYGDIKPVDALKQYRIYRGNHAKLVVNGMTATEFSIADPADEGMLDVVGFDTATPGLIADFLRA